MRPSLIGRMVWLELISLAVVGNLIGIAIGGAVTIWLERRGISFGGMETLLAQFGLPGRLYPALDWLSALAGPGAMTLAICVAGLVPYLHVQRLEAATAMRAA
jgi:putative ABC transport system permease protein